MNKFVILFLHANGFSIVHIELKRHSEVIKRTFNQIRLYTNAMIFEQKADYLSTCKYSFLPTEHHTKYYSNTMRKSHICDVKKI